MEKSEFGLDNYLITINDYACYFKLAMEHADVYMEGYNEALYYVKYCSKRMYSLGEYETIAELDLDQQSPYYISKILKMFEKVKGKIPKDIKEEFKMRYKQALFDQAPREEIDEETLFIVDRW